MKPIRTWIVIADGSRAHIFTYSPAGKALHLVPGADFRHETPPNREIYTDAPGRTWESGVGVCRSSVDQNDAHREEKARFAQQIAAFLREKLLAKEFDRWVLVAPPEILGDFRSCLDPRLKDMLTAELPKDLTKIPTAQVLDHLSDILVV